jgi:hypothetical protein
MVLQRVPDYFAVLAGGGTAGDHDQVQTTELILTCPEVFAYLALDAVAHHGMRGHLAGDRDAKARVVQAIRNTVDVEAGVLAAFAVALQGQEIFASPDALRATKPVIGGRRGQALRRARPLPRREASTRRPPLVAMRARKPWVRLRLMTLG